MSGQSDFPLRVLAAVERDWMDGEPDAVPPPRLLTPAEKAARDALLDAVTDEMAGAAIARAEVENREAIASDPEKVAQFESLTGEPFPVWQGIEVEHQRIAAVRRTSELRYDDEPVIGWRTFEDDEPSGIGGRTAADLPAGPPPPTLAGPFLDPDGATILFGRGGHGKGVTACWLNQQLVTAGGTTMILDFEGHEREWGSRLRGLGMTDADLGRIHYRAPFGADWTAPTGALSIIAPAIRADCDRLGITYIVVDSYSPATSNGDTMGGESAAREYFGALARIGRPSLTIAHVRGDSERFPERPFGSVFVHNFARSTWVIHAEGDQDNDGMDATQPNVLRLELRNQKHSGRPGAGRHRMIATPTWK